MPSTVAVEAPQAPVAPQTIEEMGVPRSMVVDLFLRFTREHSIVNLSSVRRALKLSYAVTDAIFRELRQQQLLDIRGTSGNDYQFSLTRAAQELTMDRSRASRYAGPAPVSLEQYTAVVRKQRGSELPTPARLRDAYADLVLNDEMLDQIGPALASGRPLFLYGPTGNGKTSIIERFPRIYTDSILVPYAIEVDAQVITLFDPLVHRAVNAPQDDRMDPRWVRCRRPCVMAAGELIPSMLDLSLDERSGVYSAPLQMKAANGILLIDDFGRQVMSPRHLFNRWILPLDRRVDYLSLQYGLTFQIPFELVLAFATNLEPADVADDAFLRRVPNKLYVGPVNPETFDEIFRRVLMRYELPFEPGLALTLRNLCNERQPTGLQACFPSDICEILVARAAYRRQPFHVNAETLRAAADSYFTNGIACKRPQESPE